MNRLMIDESTKDWLQRLAYGYPAKNGETPHRTEGSEHARLILAALDDADRDDRLLRQVEEAAPDPDQLVESIHGLAALRERLAETMDEHDYRGTDGNEPTDEDIAAQFNVSLAFRTDVRAMLVGTGVMAADDQTSDPINLLRLFLPSPRFAEPEAA